MTLLDGWAAKGIIFRRRGDKLLPNRRLEGADLKAATDDKLALLAELAGQEDAVRERIEEMRRVGVVSRDDTDAARWARATHHCRWPGCRNAHVEHGDGYCDPCWAAGYVVHFESGERCVSHPERPVWRFAPNGAPLCRPCAEAREKQLQREREAVAGHGPPFEEQPA